MDVSMGNRSKNTTPESAKNIGYCPYCGKDVLERVNSTDMYCMDCGRDFRIMTQAWQPKIKKKYSIQR